MPSKFRFEFLAIVAPLALFPVGGAMASMEEGFTAYQQGKYQLALESWLTEAENGNPTAQFNIGQLYRLGKGMPQDDAKAALWYQRAAEQGYAPAQRNLQLMAAEGKVSADQLPVATDKASDTRDGSGVNAYEQGNFRQALDAWLPLAAQGDATAQFNLGQLHRLGKGVVQSDGEAIRWYRRAALQGHPMALHNLKLMLKDDRVPEAERAAIQTIVLSSPGKAGETSSPSTVAMAPGATEKADNPPDVISRVQRLEATSSRVSTTVGEAPAPPVQMLSRPMIAAKNAPPVPDAVPRVSPPPALPAPPTASAFTVSARREEPPVPRPRPEEPILSAQAPSLADTLPRARVPLTPPKLPTPAPSPAVNSEAPAEELPRSERVDISVADLKEAPPVGPGSASRVSTNGVAVAEVLDMNSLVVEVEPVPVVAVGSIPVATASVGATSDAAPSTAVLRTVASVDTAAKSRPGPEVADDTMPRAMAVVAEPKGSRSGGIRGNDWLGARDPESYVIQIMASNRQRHLEAFLNTLTELGEPVSLITTRRRGRPWYVLLLGPYPDNSKASAVLDGLAARVKVNGPWIRRVGKIQSAMR